MINMRRFSCEIFDPVLPLQSLVSKKKEWFLCLLSNEYAADALLTCITYIYLIYF